MNEVTPIQAAAVPSCAAEISPKRRQITAAAERLFLAQGYGAVSMDLVARTAGVSKATLYAHFESKDALFATIVADKGEDNPIAKDMFPEEVTDLRAALEQIGQRVLRFMLRERTLAIYRLTLAEAARFPELGRAFFENGPNLGAKRFRAWLEHQVEAGLVEAADLETATHQFMALMRSGVFMRRSLGLPPEATEAEITITVTAAADTWMKAYARRRDAASLNSTTASTITPSENAVVSVPSA